MAEQCARQGEALTEALPRVGTGGGWGGIAEYIQLVFAENATQCISETLILTYID